MVSEKNKPGPLLKGPSTYKGILLFTDLKSIIPIIGNNVVTPHSYYVL